MIPSLFVIRQSELGIKISGNSVCSHSGQKVRVLLDESATVNVVGHGHLVEKIAVVNGDQ